MNFRSKTIFNIIQYKTIIIKGINDKEDFCVKKNNKKQHAGTVTYIHKYIHTYKIVTSVLISTCRLKTQKKGVVIHYTLICL